MPPQQHQGDDAGLTLVEVLVALFFVTLVTTAALGLYIHAQKSQVDTERSNKAIFLSTETVAKAIATPYENLGYYNNDPGSRRGAVALPLWKTATGGIVDNPDECVGGPCPTRLSEDQVTIGSTRPQNQDQFAPATRVEHVNGLDYRIDVWITHTVNGAKRITVQGEWPAGDGTCAAEGATCVVQTVVRAPKSNEQDPDLITPPVTCSGSTGAVPSICQTFIQSGRVLAGDSLAGLDDTAIQDDSVMLFVRTTKAASAVKAEWTWTNPSGAATKVVVNNFKQINGDPTQWRAVVDSDPADQVGSEVKGWIRNGSITAKITATIDGTATIAYQDAEWNYASNTPLKASVVSVGTCSATGNGSAARLRVSGLSIGYKQGGTSQSASDKVEATFTIMKAGKTRTQTVPATLVPGSVVNRYTSSVGVVTGGYVDADFTVIPPKDERCPAVSKDVAVTVKRATDGTTTPFNLALVSTTAGKTEVTAS